MFSETVTAMHHFMSSKMNSDNNQIISRFAAENQTKVMSIFGGFVDRKLVREVEEFEQTQVRTFQSHVEKMRCARQMYPC